MADIEKIIEDVGLRKVLEQFGAYVSYYNKLINLHGVHLHFTFENGYTASVVKSDYSYGGKRGLWEIMVLGKDGRHVKTSITDDVLGYLKEDDVYNALVDIKKLKAR